jgi:DNA polymerase sigma
MGPDLKLEILHMEKRSTIKMENSNDELFKMKKWLTSLPEQELVKAMSFNFYQDSLDSSHDFDLIKEMVNLQPQLPTPIHLSAMGVKLASASGPRDGRNELERIQKDRFERPRLFQLVRIAGSMDTDIDMAQAMTILPPEIAIMVQTESKTGKRSQNTRKKRYDVIARKFELPWGERLSTPQTEVIRTYDGELLQRTRIIDGCKLVDSGLPQTIPSCVLCNDKRRFSLHILDLLRVCSRGRCFTKVPEDDDIFLAPWFEPTKEWFSLSTYLASRFEVSLWKSFRKFQHHSSIPRILPITLVEKTWKALSKDQQRRLTIKALVDTMTILLSEIPNTALVRDATLHKLLSFQASHIDLNIDFDNPHQIDLIHLESPSNLIRKHFVQHLEIATARLAEEQLIAETPLCETKNTNKVKRKKKRIKKKFQKNLYKRSSIDEKKSDCKPLEKEGSTISVLTAELSTQIRERNQNTIFVMNIIHDIMTNVFSSVGIPDSDSDDGFKAANVKCKGKTKRPDHYILRRKEKVLETHVTPQQHNSKIISNPQTNARIISKPTISENIHDLKDTIMTLNEMTLKRNNRSTNIWEAFPPSNHDTGKNINFTFQSLFAPEKLRKKLGSSGSSDDEPFDISSDVGDPMPLSTEDSIFGIDRFTEQNFFTDLFYDRYDNHFASSTAASIASSIIDAQDDAFLPNSTVEDWDSVSDDLLKVVEETPQLDPHSRVPNMNVSQEGKETTDPANRQSPSSRNKSQHLLDQEEDLDLSSKKLYPNSPKAVPIQLSLADLGELRKMANQKSEYREDIIRTQKIATLQRSFSREDLRIKQFRGISPKRKSNTCSSRTVDYSVRSYRNATVKNLRTARSVSSHEINTLEKGRRAYFNCSRSLKSLTKEVVIDGHFQFDACAQSESALDDIEDSSHFNVIPTIEVGENDTASVGGTTISSIPAHDFDDAHILLEERNAFRDMCLTLAAENSKLKNILALERVNPKYKQTQPNGFVVNAHAFDSRFIPSSFQNTTSGSHYRYVAMSDAGVNELQMSEDGSCFDISVTKSDIGSKETVNTKDDKDHGISDRKQTEKKYPQEEEHDNTTHSAFIAPNSIYRDSGPEHFHGLQSRLSDEIFLFTEAVDAQVSRQESRKTTAINRLTNLVTTLWPRAQVKLYGSVQTNLRLPSSDIDIVICLPNVHKNSMAKIAGNLEGRNAINESSQKLLARKLKSESWIEPRSIQIIEHTVIPVIKVATKDSRSKSLQLDISFDSVGHHGLDSVQMMSKMLQEIPIIRPMVLVLKKFLTDKGLLTAYTGGLSSYGLFLLVTRYLQEQKTSWIDVGSSLSKLWILRIIDTLLAQLKSNIRSL